MRFLGGFVPGFGAWIEHYEEEDLTVILLTNLNNGAIQPIVTDLGAVLLGLRHGAPPRYHDQAVPAPVRATFAGMWGCRGGTTFSIHEAGDRLDLRWRGTGPLQPVWAQSDSVLFYPQEFAEITLRNPGGRSRMVYAAPAVAPVDCAPSDPMP